LFQGKLLSPSMAPVATALTKPFRSATSAMGALYIQAGIFCAITLGAILLNMMDFGTDPLKVKGSYGIGFGAFYLGAVLALTLRQAYRGAVLHTCEQPIDKAGLGWRLIVVSPHLETRHIFRAGPSAELRLALAGIVGALLATMLMGLGMWTDAFGRSLGSHWFGLAMLGSLTIVIGLVCPVVSSDLGKLLDSWVGTGNGRRHAGSYVRTRYLAGLKKRHLFEGEFQLIVMSLASLTWFYLTFRLGSYVIREILLSSTPRIISEGTNGDIALIVVFGLTFTATVVGVVAAFIIGITRMLIQSLPAPTVVPKSFEPDLTHVQEALKANPLFVQLTENALKALTGKAKAFEYAQGKELIKEGNWGDTFYTLSSGDVAIIHTAPSGLETIVATLHAGDSFGEMALLESAPRNATVRALTPTRVFQIERSAFLEALEAAGLERDNVTTTLRSAHALRQSAVFKDLCPASLNKLLGLCSRESRPQGDVLATEGQEGNEFFIIESGEVEVVQNSEQSPIATLGPGEFFGEIALLCDIPRTATVTAKQDCILLKLDRNNFKAVVSHDFLAGIRLEQVAQERGEGA
jgi:cAMP-dependent protein kinase regulator